MYTASNGQKFKILLEDDGEKCGYSVKLGNKHYFHGFKKKNVEAKDKRSLYRCRQDIITTIEWHLEERDNG